MECVLKKHRGVFRTIATSKMELLVALLFVALLCGFKVVANFTKYFIIGVVEILDPPLEYCNVF